jgi:SAM-dependent methyltransferase
MRGNIGGTLWWVGIINPSRRMEITTFFDLLTPSGQEALSVAQDLNPREADFLAHFQTLSRLFPPSLARASLEIAILRTEASRKFPAAAQMYFTRPALQQASSYPLSSYRAQRYREFSRLLDLGCSVGGDTLAMAEIAPACGIDRDPLRLAMARANLQALDLDAGFIEADLVSPLPLALSVFHPASLAVFFDPARRVDGRRIFSVKDYLPPLSIIRDWLPVFNALAIKISPGVDLDELATYDAEIEFISLNGGLKEAVLWFGLLKTVERRATVLPGPYTLTGFRSPAVIAQISEPMAYLYEPDPAILRAGLVRDLAIRLNAHQLDPDIAYLTSHQRLPTPFARVWEIEAWFPFQLKRLRAYLRERSVGRVVVKKRASPLQPDALVRDLRLQGDAERVVFLTHLRGRPIVVVCCPNDII